MVEKEEYYNCYFSNRYKNKHPIWGRLFEYTHQLSNKNTNLLVINSNTVDIVYSDIAEDREFLVKSSLYPISTVITV